MVEPSRLEERARQLQERGVFMGGRLKYFEPVGRDQLEVMVDCGLFPRSRVLEIGAGCFRCGWWLIHFLRPERYCAIEPNTEMTEAGREILFEDGVWEEKKPRVDHNDEFDFGVFGEIFDFCVSRSVWTHASKLQIETMLNQFVEHTGENGRYLTSIKPVGLRFWLDYRGDSWVGRSHESDEGGIVYHSRYWIDTECRTRGLTCEDLGEHFGQHWLLIEKE